MVRTNFYLVLVLIVILGSCAMPKQSYGHGSGYETLPSKMLGDKKVTMEITSSVDNATKHKFLTFSMFETDTGITVSDVTYSIKTIKGDRVLFDMDFHTDDGYLRFELVPSDTDQIKIEEKQKGSFFEILLGSSKKYFEFQGNIFGFDGLYKFEINVKSVKGSSNQNPIQYEAGISFPHTSDIVADGNYGAGQIKIISYYDAIQQASFDKITSAIEFSMPFEWSDSNINQTSTVHEEILIPKSFGEFFATKYNAYLNGIQVYEKTITIDDYSYENYRVLHIILLGPMLEKIKQENQNHNQMTFMVQPNKNQAFPVTLYTTNTQYKVNLSWNLPQIVSGSTIQFSFDIQEGYVISNKTISTDYEFSIMQQNKEIFKTKGITPLSGKNTVDVSIPKEFVGPITIKFDNIGNSGQGAEMTIVVTPEFPIAPIVMIMSFVVLILLQRFITTSCFRPKKCKI
ncbi:MAG: hypothetical protein ACT4OD_05395 [Candidatus Nitrosotenuis sp.]